MFFPSPISLPGASATEKEIFRCLIPHHLISSLAAAIFRNHDSLSLFLSLIMSFSFSSESHKGKLDNPSFISSCYSVVHNVNPSNKKGKRDFLSLSRSWSKAHIFHSFVFPTLRAPSTFPGHSSPVIHQPSFARRFAVGRRYLAQPTRSRCEEDWCNRAFAGS